ncbi:hypothetical protein TorRG33x02_307740, partial [Trema orientale]
LTLSSPPPLVSLSTPLFEIKINKSQQIGQHPLLSSNCRTLKIQTQIAVFPENVSFWLTSKFRTYINNRAHYQMGFYHFFIVLSVSENKKPSIQKI